MAGGGTGRGRGRVVVGGRGRALSGADVYNVAVLRYRVVLDRAALDTLEKEVKAAPAGKEDGTGVIGADSQEGGGDFRAPHVAAVAEIRKSVVGGGIRPDEWEEEETRAAVVGKLIELMRSRSGIGTRLVRLLEHFLNQDDIWEEEERMPRFADDGATCASVVGSPACLSAKERAALSAGTSAAIGIAAMAIHMAQTLSLVADGVVALSCEALRAHVDSFDAEQVHKCEADVAADLRTLLLGSKNINPRQGGADVACVRAVPQLHGPLREAIKMAGSAVRAELNAAGGAAAGGGSGSDKRAGKATMTEPSATVFLYLGNVVRCLSGTATASGSRCTELSRVSSSLVSSSPPSTEGKDVIAKVELIDEEKRGSDCRENGGEGGGAGIVSPQLTSMEAARDSAVARAKNVARGVDMEVLAGGGGDESSWAAGADGIRAALLAFRSVGDWREVFVVEAWMAAAVVREREAAIVAAAAAAAPKKEKKLAGDGGGEKKAGVRSGGGERGGGEQPVKAKKGGGGGGPGPSLGKGSAFVRSYVDMCRLETSPEDDGESKTALMRSSLSLLIGSEIARTSASLNPAGERLGMLLDGLRGVVESNETRRKPKIPKGTRDFTPGQMAIREKAFGTIVGVFKRHGAVAIDTPVFELRETLMGKYGEDSKLIYDLADQGGEILSLRYDLTVPFARYLATHNEGNLKRYHIARVYRRDNPAKGRYREFYQCDFDIAGQYPTMVPDSEVLKVLTEILDDLNIGDYEIKLNHRVLLDATLEIAGVPTAKFRTICSAIDKLDKETPEKVKTEMVEEKGLSEEVAEKVLRMVLRKGRPLELLEELRSNYNNTSTSGCEDSTISSSSSTSFMNHKKAAAALDELFVLFTYLEAMNAIHRVVFDLSLARGLDYYTGVIYEAVFKGTTQVGSIAAGGRYDNLVGMFSGKQVPAVGVSLGIERVLAIMMEECDSVRKTQTEVLVASIGPNMLKTRMAIASELWAAKIKAEFVFSPAPNLQKQLTYAQEGGIPWMVIFGGDEIAKGVVQIRDLLTRKQEEVAKDDLVEELKMRLAAGRDSQEQYVVVQ